ncbi:protein kinase domain containing protein [Stylonychia lemnae]|uniref:Protein kinase domain containing protein n=1 Tax=Stylonychia lemnae TaxID=5949 RepID=A0A077ZY25_STYLE|nr:protein kinase domain containing protein [Stylonychia lemnae]|eukprot:CDW74806.1 protein kinase domain containing protein [Stylonychia lemnae]
MQKREASPIVNKQESPEAKQTLQQHKNFKTVGAYTIDFSKFLGSGKYGKVYNAFHEKEYKNGKRYACKVIELGLPQVSEAQEQPVSDDTIEQKKLKEQVKLKKLKDAENQYLKKQFSLEVDTLQMVNSNHVIKVIKAYKSTSRHYLITELCNAGDLSSLVRSRSRLYEDEAIIILRQLVQGLLDIASSSIIHRDLKLANILLHFPERDLLTLKKEERIAFIKNVNLREEKFEVKISDFGFAKITNPLDQKSNFRDNTICGTPAYMSPDQIIDKNTNYTEKFDIWSLGAIYYELLVGNPPFTDKTRQNFERKLIEGNYEFPSNNIISAEGMQFISRCLQYKEDHRASIIELSDSQYILQAQKFLIERPQKLPDISPFGITSMSTEVTFNSGMLRVRERGSQVEEQKGKYNRQESRTRNQSDNMRRQRVILNSRKQYTIKEIQSKLFRQISSMRLTATEDPYSIKKAGSFGNNSKFMKAINNITAKHLTQRAQQQKFNQILFDSNIQASNLIEKANNYDTTLKKLIIDNYFK